MYGQEKLPNLVTEDFESVKEYKRRDRGRGRFLRAAAYGDKRRVI